jgi:membrane protein DedA with SNARE-associated domain
LLIGRYLFFQYGNAVVFFGRFVAVLRMFAALLAGANSMPAGRFFFFNITGGVCWACLFGFGAYAVGAEIYKISGAECDLIGPIYCGAICTLNFHSTK